ncbi:hypothetical protein RAS2_16530 [Phycisphaerae bacterium RAS2]|nr:hypothetical protein RAS2_16530 [Phycisphaerae bacterium RAS2]
MNNPVRVNIANGFANADKKFKALFQCEGLLVAIFSYWFALDVLHHDKGSPLFGYAELIHTRYVSMVQSNQSSILCFKAKHFFWVKVVLYNLDRNLLKVALPSGKPYNTRPPFVESVLHVITTNGMRFFLNHQRSLLGYVLKAGNERPAWKRSELA